MKIKPCPDCKGTGAINQYHHICDICEETGTITAEPVSHCAACGEPIELGLEWCQFHQPAADLWQALNGEIS